MQAKETKQKMVLMEPMVKTVKMAMTGFLVRTVVMVETVETVF